ncbi:MAG: hypothetical protein JSR55_14540 [Proteobacteria bacterium]|nr:hypothetical protein [Pseudomonadota bacterium]
MLRGILGVIAALVTWTIVITILNLGLRHGLPGYAAVEKAMTFTLGMMWARLAISFVATLSAGAVTAWIARDRFTWPLITGIVLLAIFIPVHMNIWEHFPLWYHLTFLPSLPILSVVGGRLVRG